MRERHKTERGAGNFGAAWLLFCASIAATITDQAINDFLGYYNATVLTLYGHFSWFPRIDMRFGTWLATAITTNALLLLFTPFAYRGARFLRPIGYVFSTFMILVACGEIFASLLGQTVPSVHFTNGAPGVYTSPLLLASSTFLLWRLRCYEGNQTRSA